MSDNINRVALPFFALGSNFRSGKIGGWADEFSDLNKQYCKQIGACPHWRRYETDDVVVENADMSLGILVIILIIFRFSTYNGRWTFVVGTPTLLLMGYNFEKCSWYPFAQFLYLHP